MRDQQALLDRIFHGLADPTRMLLVERLCLGSASVSDLARPLAMSLSAVMQHLDVLEACDIVRSEKVGRVRTCHVETRALRTAQHWISDLHDFRASRTGTAVSAYTLVRLVDGRRD